MTSPLNKLLYEHTREFDTRSESSSSVASDWSDINSIALQLGVSPDELTNERFKIDRLKLENMIKGTK